MNEFNSGTNKHEPGTRVPANRTSRLAYVASLASGLVGGMMAEGIRQVSQGNRPAMSDLLLTPKNAKRVADHLIQLRGAAMKVGQLISMDSGDLLPAEFSQILSTLRDDAKPMPFGDLAQVLHREWGDDWENRFSEFSFSPISAASIGQVHKARTTNGPLMAIKVQYPNIGKSIDSDVDNIGTLFRISGLLPKDFQLDYLLEDVKQQLKNEADYIKEAHWLKEYKKLLKDENDFSVPDVYDALTTHHILAMSYETGQKIELLANESQETRDWIGTRLIELIFREIFEFQLIQTDPNFANFLYDHQARQIILLDFGATRKYPDQIAHAYQALMTAGMNNETAQMNEAATTIGFFQDYITPEQRTRLLNLFSLACEPLRHDGQYDFGSSSLAEKISQAGMEMSFKNNYWHTPPVDAIFLHRKLAGVYLIAARLKSRVNVKKLFEPYVYA